MTTSPPDENSSFCTSCIGVTYYHRSMASSQREPRCFGLKRTAKVRRDMKDVLRSDFPNGQSSRGDTLDEMWCVGLSRKLKGGSEVVPHCGPGVRIMFVQQKLDALEVERRARSEALNPISVEEKPSLLTEISRRSQRHWKKQIEASQKVLNRMHRILSGTEFLDNYKRRLQSLPGDYLRFCRPYLQSVQTWFVDPSRSSTESSNTSR